MCRLTRTCISSGERTTRPRKYSACRSASRPDGCCRSSSPTMRDGSAMSRASGSPFAARCRSPSSSPQSRPNLPAPPESCRTARANGSRSSRGPARLSTRSPAATTCSHCRCRFCLRCRLRSPPWRCGPGSGGGRQRARSIWQPPSQSCSLHRGSFSTRAGR